MFKGYRFDGQTIQNIKTELAATGVSGTGGLIPFTPNLVAKMSSPPPILRRGSNRRVKTEFNESSEHEFILPDIGHSVQVRSCCNV